jgi:DNA-directed RNA polymerase specialized sigma24 family protein
MALPGKTHSPVNAHRVRTTQNPMRKKFDESFCEMVQSAQVQNRISWLLAKYRIQKDTEVSDIIGEAYARAIKTIAADKEITNLAGWLRVTTQHIVQEKFRAQQRGKNLTQKLIQQYDDANPIKQNVLSCTLDQPQIDELWSRLEQLQPLDRKILILQAQGQSLEQIAMQLVAEGDCKPSKNLVQNLTQRASRARKKLRKNSDHVPPA